MYLTWEMAKDPSAPGPIAVFIAIVILLSLVDEKVWQKTRIIF